MRGRISNKLGDVNISEDVIATYAGSVAVECFGVVGMAVINMKDGLAWLLNKDTLNRGVSVTIKDNEVSLSMHIIVAYGVSISAVADNLIENVRYKVEEFTGMKVGSAVPYITGLDKFLGTTITPAVDDWLKDFGAATASNGAVGLFHIEGVTPEAKKLGRKLIAKNAPTYTIDEKVLAATKKGYPVLWKDPSARPRYAFIGCPHSTLNQLSQWDVRIDAALKAAGKDKVEIPVIICASPLVIDHLTPAQKARMKKNGIHISFLCGAMYMINKVSASYPCITNSNKLRTYSTARFYEDDELLEYVVTGKAPKAA